MNNQDSFLRCIRNAILPSLVLWALIIWAVLALFGCDIPTSYDHLVCYDATGEKIKFEVTTQKVWLSDGGFWNWTRSDGVTVYRKAEGICELRQVLK